MALTITTLNLLNEYINGVMNRADHHGQNVNKIVLATFDNSTSAADVKRIFAGL